MKSTGVSYKPKEKKTGALSPRAPEKIKKNRAEEMKVYGENACLELFAERPESIVRVWQRCKWRIELARFQLFSRE